jgi:hypothetical protein
MKTITSAVIGPLRQSEDFDDWWSSEGVPIPFFNNLPMPVTFIGFGPEEAPKFITEADEALKHFLKLAIPDRIRLSGIVYRNCLESLDGLDAHEQEKFRRIEEHDIWKQVFPKEVYLMRRPYKQHDMYVQVSCECSWEPEHGLQLVFRQGKKLTRVSGHDGHLTEADAFDKPDEEDELLSQF